MSDAMNAMRDLLVVLETVESHVTGAIGLTVGFSDGLRVRLRASERIGELLIRSGYSEGEMTAGRAPGASTEELLAFALGVAATARVGSAAAAPAAVAPEPIELEDLAFVDAEPVETRPVDVEPIEFDPIDLDPIDVESVALEPIDLEPIDLEPVELGSDSLVPIEDEPEDGLSPLPIGFGEEEDEHDATEVLQRGAIPVGFDDDDDESTLVMGADDARALMANISGGEDHFDLVGPEAFRDDETEDRHDVLPPDEDTDESPMERFYEERAAASPPQVREISERPSSAAIQLNADQGGARIFAPEEEVEIAVEAAPDEDDYDYDSEGGFALSLEEEDYEEYEEEEPELDEEPEPAKPAKPAAPIPEGPSAEVIEAFVAQAKHELEQGSVADAAAYYSDALDGDSRNGDLRLARGRLFMNMGDYSRAVSDFLIGEEIMPRSAEPQVLMGELYSHKKDYAKAISYLDLALRLDSQHPMAYYRRGLCFYQTKDYKKAVDDLGRARALDEDLPSINHFLASAMKKARR